MIKLKVYFLDKKLIKGNVPIILANYYSQDGASFTKIFNCSTYQVKHVVTVCLPTISKLCKFFEVDTYLYVI